MLLQKDWGDAGKPILLRIPVDKGSPSPVYVQIADGIRALISDGRLPGGAALPAERVLCEAYSVSRMTLRQALSILDREGLVSSERGRGTFITTNRVQKQQQELKSFSEEIAARGAVPSSRIISFRLIHPGFAASEFFGLPSTETVYELIRVRLSDGLPLALEHVHIPRCLAPDLDRFDLARNSLYRTLEQEYGLRLTHCIEEIAAVFPNATQKQMLNLPRSTAVLLVKRKAFTANETPVELAVAAYRADLYTAIVRSNRTTKNS